MEKNITNNKLSSIYSYYKYISPFVMEHNKISYIDFDYLVSNKLSLFTVANDLDFNVLEKQIAIINKYLPAVNNIFKRPILHLKQEDIVMPVEAVTRMDSDTFNHIFSHSELWEDIQDSNVKPSKLMTKVYQDNYGIYENLVFCNVVDDILTFIHHNRRLLQDFIFTKQTIELNLLQRNNHLSYFLSLGKLHTGYARWYDNFSDVIQNSYQQLSNMHTDIVSKLNRPVYRKNRNRPRSLKVKKTNILSMHKDYHRVYLLNKHLAKSDDKVDATYTNKQIRELKKSYYYYTQILSLFALTHFNFSMSKRQKIDFTKLHNTFRFKDWVITINKRRIRNFSIIHFEITKNLTYNIVLIPNISDESSTSIIQKIKEVYFADEYIICNPYDGDETCNLSINDLESFRRIQQIILKGMITSDQKRKDCPFCHHDLHLQENLASQFPKYLCNHCKTVIVDAVCPISNQNYTYTTLANLKHDYLRKEDFTKLDEWIYFRKLEASMFYRNITKINNYKEIICPHCGQIHNH